MGLSGYAVHPDRLRRAGARGGVRTHDGGRARLSLRGRPDSWTGYAPERPPHNLRGVQGPAPPAALRGLRPRSAHWGALRELPPGSGPVALSPSAAGASQRATAGAPRRSAARAVPPRRGAPAMLPLHARRRQQAAPFTRRPATGPVRQTVARDGMCTRRPTVISVLWPAFGCAGGSGRATRVEVR